MPKRRYSLKIETPAVAAAEWLFGPEHAFVMRCAASTGGAPFTAHMLTSSFASNRPDLVKFVLSELVSVGLLVHAGPIYRCVPCAFVDNCIEAVADGDLSARRSKQTSGKRRKKRSESVPDSGS